MITFKGVVNMRHKLLVAVVVVVLLVSTMVATIAQAETGPLIAFESPTYSVGNINGQDGWKKTGSYDVEVVTQNTYPSFGSQSLRMSNAITSPAFGDNTFSKSLENEAGETEATNKGLSGGERQPVFEAQWDFASVTGVYQPGLWITTSPDRGDGSRMSYVSMSDEVDGLAVSFYDAQYDVPGPGTAQFDIVTVASGLDRTVPHTIKIRMEFYDGPSNDVVTVTVDDTYTYTGTSWEDYYRWDPEASAEQSVRTVDSILFQTRGTSAPATQGAGFYVDNFQLSSGDFAPPLTPSEMVDNLQDSTADLVENRKSERTLLSSLNRVERFMEIRPQFARLALFQYILQVQLFDAFGLIDDAAADQLMEQAQDLMASLS